LLHESLRAACDRKVHLHKPSAAPCLRLSSYRHTLDRVTNAWDAKTHDKKRGRFGQLSISPVTHRFQHRILKALAVGVSCVVLFTITCMIAVRLARSQPSLANIDRISSGSTSPSSLLLTKRGPFEFVTNGSKLHASVDYLPLQSCGLFIDQRFAARVQDQTTCSSPWHRLVTAPSVSVWLYSGSHVLDVSPEKAPLAHRLPRKRYYVWLSGMQSADLDTRSEMLPIWKDKMWSK
jgi:hypothetical protein